MADKRIIYHDVESSESWELFHDEWTILDENSSEKDNNGDSNNDVDGINKDQESSESMEVIAIPNKDTMDDEMENISVEKHDEDSDGISVITESEAEQLVVNKKSNEIDSCRNNVFGALKMYEKTAEKTAPQVGTVLNVVIACSLAAIIGLGAGRILGMDDKCPVTNAVDFSTIKSESDNLINQIKELSEVKDVLDEIKASIPQVKRAQEKMLQRESKLRSKRFERQEKPSKISDTYIFDPDTTILEQLQTSLNTLYSVIDGMNPENDFIKSDTARTQRVVADLIEFKKIIFTVVTELEDTGRPKEIKFLRHAEKRIRDVCESLLNDLSYTIHGLTMKIHHKLNKVRRKLNKRLCLLKNSESMGESVFKSLEENNSFLESCDKILNVTLKPSPQAAKTHGKEKSDKKIYSTTRNQKKTSHKTSISESDDDSYPRDTSSESSMADSTYKPNINNSLKKKQILQQERKETKKSGKILLENNSKRRKIRSPKSMKSSKRQCLRKSMMEVLLPAESCPLTQEHWSELDSVHPEIQKLETHILNRKPLYSTIVKSVVDVKLSAQNNFNEKKLSEKTEVHVTAQAIDQPDQEFREEVVKAKEDLMETKHNVTPAESGISVQTMKSMKEKWNTNIRQPIGKYNKVPRDQETLQLEKVPVKKHKDPQLSENDVKVPPSLESLKHCRKGKKCLFNDSATSTASHKKFAPTTSDTDNNKHKKSSDTKNEDKRSPKVRNDDEKKPKKAKFEKKISLLSKINDTKKEKGFKKRTYNKKNHDHLAGDWQLQRSRAREMHRDRDHRSEWFFDRADSRQDARKNMHEVRSAKSRAGRFSRDQPCKSHHKEECAPIFEESTNDEEFYDYWKESKDMNSQKHRSSRAGFTAKKMIKMPHRKNIMQSKRR